MAPLVSVIMPAHNAEGTIARSIESVTRQSLTDLELLVVDDASKDGTSVIVRELAGVDPRIRCIAPNARVGVVRARNAAIEAARGQYLAFLDADDLWRPEKLEVQLDSMARRGAKASCTGYEFVNEARMARRNIVPVPVVTLRQFEAGNPVGNLTGVYDCRALGKVLQRSIGHEDYAMWIEVCRRNGGILGVPDVLATYFARAGSLSGNKWQAARWTWNVLRSELGLSRFRATMGMLRYGWNGVRRHGPAAL